MSKKILTSEVKLGAVAVITIAVLYFGLNFLKGTNIFTPSQYYYGTFDRLDGLVVSAPVYIQGYKVGQVDDITYDFSTSPAFTVRILVNKDLQFPLGTRMELADAGLLGDKMIQIVLPEDQSGPLYHSKDTLPSEISGGLMANVAALLPTLQETLQHVDSLVCAAKAVVSGPELQKTLADLSTSSAELKKMMKQQFPQLVSDIQLAVNSLKTVGDNLAQVDFQATMGKVDGTLDNLQLFTDRLNSADGTLGLLMNDKELYLNLSNTVSSADKLLVDLKANPKRYVHFSLFGRKDKE